MASNLVCGLCVPIVGTHNRGSPNIFIPSMRSAKSPFSPGLIVVALCSKTLASRRGPGVNGSQFFHSYESLRVPWGTQRLAEEVSARAHPHPARALSGKFYYIATLL